MRLTSIPFLFAALLFSATLFSSCAAKQSAAHHNAYYGNNDFDQQQDGLYANANGTYTVEEKRSYSDFNSKTEYNGPKMLVYNANIGITVKNSDSTISQITRIAEEQKGYVVSKSNYQITIRIESEKLDGTVAQVSKLGKLTRKSVSTTDVSDNYADIKIRLDNAEKARTRYLELLAKAENVEAALKVEKELERLNTEIDQLRGQVIKMEHDVRFSTLTVNVNQKQKLGPLGYLFVGIGKGIGWLFVRG
ncbi:MAG: DUF4349 domain-containing protein [Sediminibacterium sp.]